MVVLRDWRQSGEVLRKALINANPAATLDWYSVGNAIAGESISPEESPGFTERDAG